MKNYEFPIKSYIIYHRNFPYPPNGPYHSIVAKENLTPPEGVDFIRDDTGDHVAHMSKYWAEFTVMYWVWKNAVPSRYVSFPHYRRLLWGLPTGSMMSRSKIYIEPTVDNLALLVSTPNMQSLVDTMTVAEAIVPAKARFSVSIRQQYCDCHLPDNWSVFRDCVFSLGGDFAKHISFFDMNYTLHLYQIFVMRWEDFTEYMELIVGLFRAIHPSLCFSGNEGEGKGEERVPAFLAERFLNYYFYIKRTRLIELPICILDKSAF
jgi:hypothetical protein